MCWRAQKRILGACPGDGTGTGAIGTANERGRELVMFVAAPQIQAAALRRQDIVAQAIHEQWVTQHLALASTRRTHLTLAWPSLSRSVRHALCAARYLLTSLATEAFGLSMN